MYTLDSAIVLADGLIELDADPFAYLKGGAADESDYSTSLGTGDDGPKLWIHGRCYEDMDAVRDEFGVVYRVDFRFR